MSHRNTNPFSSLMRTVAQVEPNEVKAVWLSFFFVFTLMAAYYILRPIRDAMSSDWTDAELELLLPESVWEIKRKEALHYGFTTKGGWGYILEKK